jgi:hypothetical protein
MSCTKAAARGAPVLVGFGLGPGAGSREEGPWWWWWLWWWCGVVWGATWPCSLHRVASDTGRRRCCGAIGPAARDQHRHIGPQHRWRCHPPRPAGTNPQGGESGAAAAFAGPTGRWRGLLDIDYQVLLIATIDYR